MSKNFNSKRILYAFILGVCVFVLDMFTKSLTHSSLPVIQSHWKYPYGGIGVFKDFLGIEFSVSHQINYGAAWGMFGNYQIPLLYLRIFLIIGLICYVIFFNPQRSWLFPLSLVIAGALGNIIDYFIYGHVVDMFHFVLWGYDFPVFNVADSAIFIGISWLILSSAVESQKKENSALL